MNVEKIKSVITDFSKRISWEGGVIKFVEAKDGIVKIELAGACQGCMGSDMTFSVIKKEILRECEDVKEVIK